MSYKGLFTARYELTGSNWIYQLSDEDRRVLIDIGLQAADHGKLGGRALVEKRGREYMATIGRRGAIVTNIQRQFKAAVAEETARMEDEP